MNEIALQIMPVLSILVAIGTLAGLIKTQKNRAVEEGTRLESYSRMRDDITVMCKKLHTLEACSHDRDIEFMSFKKDVEYIKMSIDDVKASLKRLEKHG